MIVSFCSVVHRLRRTSPVSNSTCRYSLDISLSSSLCLSLSAYADCPVEMGGSSAASPPSLMSLSHRSSRLGATPWRRAVEDTVSPGSKLCSMIVSFCSVVHRLRRTSPVSNSTCRYSLDISLSSSLCLSLSAYADCPVETGGSSITNQLSRFRREGEQVTLNARLAFGNRRVTFRQQRDQVV